MKSVLMAVAGIVIAALVVGCYLLWTPDRKVADLEAKYLKAKSDYVDVAGMRLHVRDTGNKQASAIVLLHGFGASLHTWEAWAVDLTRDYRVVRFDLPGFGLTGADPTGDYTDARSIAVITALMDKLGIARATLIGNSMGGRMAWTFAALHPTKVDKLVLISPDGFASPGMAYGKKVEVPAMMKLMRYALPKAMLRPTLAAAYTDPSTLTDELLNRYYNLMLAPGVRDAVLARMAQVVLQDPVPLLRRITAPTLLLWGEKDAMIPVTNAEDYRKTLPNSTLVKLSNLGHLPFEEAPAQSLEPVRAFLAKRR